MEAAEETMEVEAVEEEDNQEEECLEEGCWEDGQEVEREVEGTEPMAEATVGAG